MTVERVEANLDAGLPEGTIRSIGFGEGRVFLHFEIDGVGTHVSLSHKEAGRIVRTIHNEGRRIQDEVLGFDTATALDRLRRENKELRRAVDDLSKMKWREVS